MRGYGLIEYDAVIYLLTGFARFVLRLYHDFAREKHMKHDILSLIQAMNIGKTVKIRHTKSSSGKTILYLEYYHKGIREKYYPGLHIMLSKESVKQDAEMLRRIGIIRDHREREMVDGKDLSPISKVTFASYADNAISDKNPKNKLGYMNAISKFNKLFPSIMIDKLTYAHANKFSISLSDLSPCTYNHYIVALRHICQKAVREKYLKENPFAHIKGKRATSKREYLTIPELQKLSSTEPPIHSVRDAFLFSCYTGLRLGDIIRINSHMIDDGYITFVQSKTGSQERMKLPSQALDIIEGKEGVLFPLPAHKQMRNALSLWVKKAGIDKHITFHCARHTFATLQLTLGTDIYTVSKLLGHSDVRVTQLYAKLIDQKKDDAMDRISCLHNQLSSLDNSN